MKTKIYSKNLTNLRGHVCVVATKSHRTSVPVGTEVFVPAGATVLPSDYVIVNEGSEKGNKLRVLVGSLILKEDFEKLSQKYGKKLSFQTTFSETYRGGMPGKLQFVIAE